MMSEAERALRWREQQKQEGLKAVNVFLKAEQIKFLDQLVQKERLKGRAHAIRTIIEQHSANDAYT